MPIISRSSYEPNPFYLQNRHLETLVPSLMARKESVTYQRERLELADGDFLDLDWLRNGHRRLIVLSAGMEGDSQRHYMKRTAGYFFTRGWDVLAWNYRSCSGELNRLPKLYSYADTDDYRVVIDHSVKKGGYSKVALVGFSMGGCLATKYLGEQLLPNPRVVASVSFSVSCNLKDSMKATERSLLYNHYFINKIKSKLQSKAAFHPAIKNIPIAKINTFDDYLFHYTIPFHGFKDAADFYVHSSCEQFIASIRVPSLMVNALNDPILGNQCYPYKSAEHNTNFYLETPSTGGHLAFSLVNSKNSWMEIRAYEFITSQMP